MKYSLSISNDAKQNYSVWMLSFWSDIKKRYFDKTIKKWQVASSSAEMVLFLAIMTNFLTLFVNRGTQRCHEDEMLHFVAI